MNYSKFKFTLDTHKHQSQVSVPVMVGDTAVQLYITLTDGGFPYRIEDGCRAVLVGMKPDGNPIKNDCTIENNTIIRYDFTEQTTSVAGTIPCEVRLYGPNGLLTSPCFSLVVDARISHNESDLVSDYESTALDRVFMWEGKRVANEQERISAEALRIEAEEARIEAENERIAAEEARKDVLESLAKGTVIVGDDAEGSARQVGSSLSNAPNSAYGEFSSAFGMNTIAGSMGYSILEELPDVPGYRLDSVEGLQRGFVYSIFWQTHKEQVGTILDILAGNIIKVDNFIAADWSGFDALGLTSEAKKAAYIRIDNRPDLGSKRIGETASAEGTNTKALAFFSHAEGFETQALGKASHAEGEGTIAYYVSHAEGMDTKAAGFVTHTEGRDTVATGAYSHAEGEMSQAVGRSSHAEGYGAIATGDYSHAEGQNCHAEGYRAHAEGVASYATGSMSHAEGDTTRAEGYASHSEGSYTNASGSKSHAEGGETQATGEYSHSEGYQSKATGIYSHAEGMSTQATSQGAHAEGRNTKATHWSAHAEGVSTTASGLNSHAEGANTTASGEASHAQGALNTAKGAYSFAGGYSSEAGADRSFVHGNNLKSTSRDQFVVGKFNNPETNAIFVVGTGADDTNRKNGLLVFSTGDVMVANDPTNTRHVATKNYVDTQLAPAKAFLNSANIDSGNTKVIDTLKEIQDYIKSDESGASAMAASIQQNTEMINTIAEDYVTKDAISFYNSNYSLSIEPSGFTFEEDTGDYVLVTSYYYPGILLDMQYRGSSWDSTDKSIYCKVTGVELSFRGLKETWLEAYNQISIDTKVSVEIRTHFSPSGDRPTIYFKASYIK